MSIFTVPIGNDELPEQYRNISIDLAQLFHSIKDTEPKVYIKELILAMDGIETIVTDFEDWERVVFEKKLLFIINLLKK